MYDNAVAQTPDAGRHGDVGCVTLPPGVYNATSSLGLTGMLTLDVLGDRHTDGSSRLGRPRR
jgi:hypothetical protein